MARLAERLLRDVFDVGLMLGHSVRTPEEACRLACEDATICTSLIESRLLAGSAAALRAFDDAASGRRCRGGGSALLAAIDKERAARSG